MHGHSDRVGDEFLRLFSLRIVFAWRVNLRQAAQVKVTIFPFLVFVRLVRLALQVRAMEGREGGGEQSK